MMYIDIHEFSHLFNLGDGVYCGFGDGEGFGSGRENWYENGMGFGRGYGHGKNKEAFKIFKYRI